MKKRKLKIPRVKIIDAPNGLIEIRTTRNTSKGIHKITLESKGGFPLVHFTVLVK